MACTIASFLPFPIREPSKPGLCPGTFPIDASDGIKPAIFVVEDAVRAQYDENFKIIDMPVPASVVANSIIVDYILGQLQTDPDKGPGIFWVEGQFSADEILKRFPAKVKETQDKQTKWFQALVKSADDTWQQHHQHRFIADLQRTAARVLNYKREWLDDASDRSVKCPACMTIISRDASICFACKAIVNVEKAKQFQFAG